MPGRPAIFPVFLWASPLIAAVSVACGGPVRGPVAGGSPVPIVHEPCDGGKTESVDVNNDGKPNIVKHFDSGREVCRASDLNRDGRPELYQYFASDGQLRRRESDYNDDGLPELVEYFEGGRLVRREIDTRAHGYIDTWDTVDPQSGKVIKRERDTLGRGRVDQWWTWDGEKLTIEMDKSGDGKADPESTMLMTTAGGGLAPVLAPSAAMPPGTDAGSSAAPTGPDPSHSTQAPLDPSPAPSPVFTDGGAPKPRRGAAKR